MPLTSEEYESLREANNRQLTAAHDLSDLIEQLKPPVDQGGDGGSGGGDTGDGGGDTGDGGGTDDPGDGDTGAGDGGTPPPVTSGFLFGATAEQIQAMPTSGAAWENVLAHAGESMAPNLNDISSKSASHAFAAALVAVRLGDDTYRAKVVDALEALRTWGGTYYYSACYRQMAGWVLAADLVGHRTPEMLAFFDTLRTKPLAGNSRFGSHGMEVAAWDSPNNHGAHARGAYIACSLFVGDTDAVAKAKGWVRCWLGDRTEHTTYTSGSIKPGGFCPTDLPYTLTWAHDPNTWTGINPAVAIPEKEGAVVMDIEREATSFSTVGGKPKWGGSGVQYTYGAMQGTLTAMVLLAANGWPDIWSWSDNAGVRWRNYLQRYGGNAVDSNYHSHAGWVDTLLNRKYSDAQRSGVTFTGHNEDSYGYGYTDWLLPA